MQDKDLEIANVFFSSMHHLQVDKDFMQKILAGYILDAAYSGTSVPRGTHLNDHYGLYYFGDKVCIVSSTLPTRTTVPYRLPVSPHHDTT